MSKSDQIRNGVAEYFGPLKVKFTTKEVISNIEMPEGVSSKSSLVSSALGDWIERGLIIKGYYLINHHSAASNRLYELRPAGKTFNEVLQVYTEDDAPEEITVKILEANGAKMLVRHEGKIYRMEPLSW